jgi:hypothetical protein
MTSLNCRRFLPLGLLLITALSARADSIWIEGEDARTKSVTKHSWYDVVKKEGMSGHEWLSHYDAKPGTAGYTFDVARPGQYTFWWRGNPFAAKVSYALNGARPVEIDFAEKRGEYMISENPDHRFLAWVKVGKVALVKGTNTITFRFHSDLSNHGGVDCFLFDNTGFIPSGADRPLARKPGKAGPADWFPAVFDDDAFSDRSVIDVSRTIEAPAGAHGFLKRSGADLKFERAKEPIKFWGCGANLMFGQLSRGQLTQRARYLRKHGVNMVREHPLTGDLGPPIGGQLDAKRLDDWDWWCAELKKNGIYMTWSVFYGNPIAETDGYDKELFQELDVVDAGKGLRNTYGVVNVEPVLQDLQLRYLEAVLKHKNPHTGLRPVDDPALAVVEFQNEDCIFFYFPLNVLAEGKKWPRHSQRLRRRWFGWAKKAYGGEAGFKRAWGSLLPGDNPGAGELQLMGAHHLGGDGPQYEMTGQTKRAGDFIRFLTELQRSFYEHREKELRALGFKAVTVTTAWRSGGPAADPANLYCDTAADMIDRHNYFGGGEGGHGIKAGKVNNESHLTQPGNGILSMGLYQVADRPFACTEWTQSPPNQWKAEAAPLVAFYGMCLQGWDASYHFTQSRARPGDGWPDLNSYVTDTPHYIGQFPALSLAVRNRHIKEGPAAAARHVRVEELFTGTDALKQDLTGGGYDAKTIRGRPVTPVEALAIGRVTVAFDRAASKTEDLSRYWDTSHKVVRSMTGELTWDYGRQVVTVGAPKTHAIVGRAGGQSFELPAVSARITTPFVSLIFTALDDQPLAQSRHVLITALARDTQTAARYNNDGTQLEQIGGPPLLLEPVQATVRLKGSAPTAVNALDVYGVPTDQKVPVGKDGSFALSGIYQTYYYEIKR